ncbi:hypothetical protein PENTCL1PPCAC_8641, partial [Pristionchus entomophagus]
SMVSARQFDPHDPRYYQCCCGARVHVAAMAKAVAGICIISNVFNIWNALANSGSLSFVIGGLVGSGLIAVAAFQEHRPTLIFYMVLQGLGIAVVCMMLLLTFVALVILKVDVPQGVNEPIGRYDATPEQDVLVTGGQFLIRTDRVKVGETNSRLNIPAREMGMMFVLVTIFQLGLLLWSFAVMLHFYTFLSDRERAGAVPVVYQTRPAAQPQQQTTGGRGRYDRRKQPSNADHIQYPIYNGHRTPSLTPYSVADRTSSAFQSADPVQPAFTAKAPSPRKIVCDDDSLPPPYESIHEKKEEDEEKEEESK